MKVKTPQFILLALIAISFPLHYSITNKLIILFVISWLVEGRLKEKVSRLIKNKSLLLYLSYYAIFAISLIYTVDIQKGIKELDAKVFLLIFPLIIGTMGTIKQGWQNKILIFFLLGCNLAAIYLIVTATVNYYIGDYLLNPFFYQEFTMPMRIHAIYFAMYVLFSLVILIDLISKKWRSVKKLVKVGLVGSVFLLSATLIMCSSKTMILIPFILIVVLLLKQMRTKNVKFRYSYVILGIAIFVAVIGLSIQKIDVVRERVEKGIFHTDFYVLKKNHLTYEEKMALNGVNVRLLFWKIGIFYTIDANKFFIGNTPGDVERMINKEYVKYNLSPNWFTNYNMHNQYVEEFVRFGVIGLLLFVSLIIIAYRKSQKDNNMLYFLFLLIFSLACLTESTLERNKGIVFFCFFNSLFLFQNCQLRFCESDRVTKKKGIIKL